MIKITKKKSNTKRFKNELEKLKNTIITVGVHKHEGKKKVGKRFNILGVATVNEFGSTRTITKLTRFKVSNNAGMVRWVHLKPGKVITIPERSFVRKLYTDNKQRAKLKEKIAALYHDVITGKKNTPYAAKELGRFAQEMIQDNILNCNTPPNAELTQWQKGFNDPLLNSGKLFDSVKFRIRKKNDKKS